MTMTREEEMEFRKKLRHYVPPMMRSVFNPPPYVGVMWDRDRWKVALDYIEIDLQRMMLKESLPDEGMPDEVKADFQRHYDQISSRFELFSRFRMQGLLDSEQQIGEVFTGIRLATELEALFLKVFSVRWMDKRTGQALTPVFMPKALENRATEANAGG